MIRSSKKYKEAAEAMKPYLQDCKQLKSSKNKVVLTGRMNFFDTYNMKPYNEELKVTVVDNEPMNPTEKDFRAHMAMQAPEMASVFTCKSLITVEKKVGKKWLESTQEFLNCMQNNKTKLNK
jgi:hypothetical protein